MSLEKILEEVAVKEGASFFGVGNLSPAKRAIHIREDH